MPQNAPKMAPHAPKCPQNGSTCPKMPPKWLHMPKNAPKTAHNAAKTPVGKYPYHLLLFQNAVKIRHHTNHTILITITLYSYLMTPFPPAAPSFPSASESPRSASESHLSATPPPPQHYQAPLPFHATP